MQSQIQRLEVRLMKQTKNIILRFTTLLAVPFVTLAVLLGPNLARAAEPAQSPWVEGFNNKVRLIAGRTSGQEAAVIAGIELQMPKDWKTYWRNPGEAGGIPPEFDFSGSENLESATVLYPAPHRLVDPKAGTNIGYKDHVIFPVRVTPKDKAKPVSLKVMATYGVCKDICVPAEAALGIEIAADAAPSPELAGVLATVPASMLDPTKDPSLQRWRVDEGDGKPKLVLEVKDPGGDDSDAFLFSPDGLYMPMTKKMPGANGLAMFEVDLTDGVDLKDLQGKSISVTLAGSKGQSETIIQLPSARALP